MKFILQLFRRIRDHFKRRAKQKQDAARHLLWRQRGEQEISVDQLLSSKFAHKDDRALFHRMTTGPQPWDDPNWKKRQQERKSIVNKSLAEGKLAKRS